MPNIGNYAKVIQTFKKVLAASEEHAAKMPPDVSEVRDELYDALQRAEAAKARQDSHAAARQATTQELTEIVDRGRDLVMRIQSAAKLSLGPRSEHLVQFEIAPLRRRSRRPAGDEPPEPPPPPVEAPAPEAQSPGSEQ